MEKSSVELKLFGGSTMKPTGECDLHAKHNGTKHILKFQVIQDKCKPLLSAETCENLQLIQLNASVMDSVHQLNDSVGQEPLSKEANEQISFFFFHSCLLTYNTNNTNNTTHTSSTLQC